MEEATLKTYAESELKSWGYYINRIEWCENRLKELEHQKSGGVKSPRIKSPEEAKYQSGTRIYQNNVIEIMSREEYTKEALEDFRKHLERIERFVKEYAKNKRIRITLELAYKTGMSAKEIAVKRGVTRQYVSHLLYETVDAFASFIEADTKRKC
jgi:L-fucose isomerase-like protein